MVKSAKPATLAVTRGDMWLVALDPTVGSEIQKTRPCVIISPPEMHDHLRDKQRLVRRLSVVERRTLRATLARLRDVFAD